MAGIKRMIRRALGWPDRGPDLLRYSMYRRLLPLLGDLSAGTPVPGRVLGISGGGYLAEPFEARGCEIVVTKYPEVDWHELPFADASFDVVLSDQVLEHVVDPFRCIAEARRVLRPGGLQIHTTCLINPIHGAPDDYWRFTPEGLRRLFATEKHLEVGGWGNPLAPLIWFFPSLMFRPTPVARRNPLHWLATWNNERWPVVTWYVGRADAPGPP